MLLSALPKRLGRKVITKLGLNPLELHTIEYRNLKGRIATRITAVEALIMFKFLAPTLPPSTTVSPAPLAPTASTSPTANTSTSASPGSSFPSVSSTLGTLITHMPSPVSMTSLASATSSPAALASLAPFAPAAAETTTTIPQAANVPSTTVKITTLCSASSPAAKHYTIRAGPPVQW
jgi:hypothetical protein